MINQTALNLENKIPIESSNESTSVNISPVSYNNSAEKCHLNSHDTQMVNESSNIRRIRINLMK